MITIDAIITQVSSKLRCLASCVKLTHRLIW